jgi:hypothetical protein
MSNLNVWLRIILIVPTKCTYRLQIYDLCYHLYSPTCFGYVGLPQRDTGMFINTEVIVVKCVTYTNLRPCSEVTEI